MKKILFVMLLAALSFATWAQSNGTASKLDLETLEILGRVIRRETLEDTYGPAAQGPQASMSDWYARKYLPDSDPAYDGNDGIVVIGYKRANGTENLMIPRQITDGSVQGTVIGIGVDALSNMGLTGAITIPDTVAFILSGAFSNNKLETVNFPAPAQTKITYIGNNAFANNLLTAVAIPETIEAISYGTFTNNKLQTVTIPSSIITIENQAFANNEISKLVFAKDMWDQTYLTEIGNDAFANNLLQRVEIPYGVEKIGTAAFSVNQITEVRFPAEAALNEKLTELADEVFSHNNLVSFIIPKTILRIGKSAFSVNALQKISIPNTVEIIDEGAFSVNQLAKLVFEGSDTQYAREGIQTLGSSVKTIGQGAFSYNRLVEVAIPDSTTAIENYAFTDNKLTRIQFGAKVKTIGDMAFVHNQLAAVTIPDGVEAIGAGAFLGEAGWNVLTSVSFGRNVRSIGANAFSGNALTEMTLPNSVRTIGQRAFADNLLTKVNLGNGVSEIEFEAFANNRLSALVLPKTLGAKGNIAPRAFTGNAAITEWIILPVGLHKADLVGVFDSEIFVTKLIEY
ncbi:leucine-rich repeat domain-containing protein [Breznakiellaceae bacterium SP9]